MQAELDRIIIAAFFCNHIHLLPPLPPPATRPEMPVAVKDQSSEPTKAAAHRAPLRSTGSLDNYSSFDVTPFIGTEFRELSKDNKEILLLSDVLKDEQKLRDLAVLM